MTFPSLTANETRIREECIQSALRSKSAYHDEDFWCGVTYFSPAGLHASVIVSQPGFHVADLARTVEDKAWAVIPGTGSLPEHLWQRTADYVRRHQVNLTPYSRAQARLAAQAQPEDRDVIQEYLFQLPNDYPFDSLGFDEVLLSARSA